MSGPNLNPEVILTLLQHAKDEDRSGEIKLTKHALAAATELCRLFVVSARARAEAEAHSEGHDTIAPEHVEAVMAELLQDF